MKRVAASRVYRLLYPTVPVVVAASSGGRVSAMPAVSVISLSNDPALVGISSSPSHATHGTIVRAGSLSVSWLGREYAEVVEALGSASGAKIRDKLGAAGLHYSLKGPLKVPVIGEASAYLECALAGVHRFGDHDLLVAEVREARAIADFRDYWAFEAYHPILYSGMGRPRIAPADGSVRRS
jgi:flavin reductase (DIM6/NTAB) family NADH-FMN oxidoreductase RutF